MDDVLGPEPTEPQVEPKPVETTKVEKPESDVAPTATDTDSQVPLKALEAERSKRREWRDKYQHLQGQFDAMQRMQQGVQPREPQQPQDPIQSAVERAENARLDMSEMLARDKFGDAEVDAAFAKFQDATAKDPTLFQRAMRDKNPWVFVVKEVKKMEVLEAMGDDPTAYEQKLREKWLAETQTQAAPKTPLPTSLASTRSSAARTAPGFSGPPSFDDVFK